MWQDKLKKIKKQAQAIEKRSKEVALVTTQKPQAEIKFSDYCQQNNISRLKCDTIEPITSKPVPHSRQISVNLKGSDGLDFFDELSSDEVFYRNGQKNLPKELRNNKYRVQLTLELHNFTKIHAVDLLTRFIEEHGNSGKCLKIIHGQGNNSRDNQPILLNIVRKLLKHMPQVLAYSYGTPQQGGNGVTLVKLSR